MKLEDIEKKEEFECSSCGKKLKKGENIHFMSQPQLIGFGEDSDEEEDEEVKAVCEECHNKAFGED